MREPLTRHPSVSDPFAGDEGPEDPPSFTGEGSGEKPPAWPPLPLRRPHPLFDGVPAAEEPGCIGCIVSSLDARALPFHSPNDVPAGPARVGLCALLGALGTPYAPMALIPRVTMRGTVGPRCGLRIGTACTLDVERTELAREMPVCVVCVVLADEMLVSESELLAGPPGECTE